MAEKTTAIETIGETDLAIHRVMLAQINALTAEAQGIARSAQTISANWAASLTDKYQLPQGTSVDPDGVIHRPPSLPPPPVPNGHSNEAIPVGAV